MGAEPCNSAPATPASEVENSKQAFSLLESAEQCAAYIQGVYDSVPPARGTTRHQLQALKGMLFVSDYIMAAKTESLPLSKQGVAAAFGKVSPSDVPVTSYLQTYSSSDRTLGEHYQLLRRHEAAGVQVKEIESAIQQVGVSLEPDSDLLIDCIRLAALLTEVREVYGPKQSLTDDSIPIPEEESAIVESFTKVFRYRMQHRYGLEQSNALELVKQLSIRKIAGLSPAEFEIPARLQ